MDALASQPVERRSAPRDSPGVLLVDHETALRSVLAQQLQARGYRVISAASGGEALTILAEEAETIMRDSDTPCPEKPFTDAQLHEALGALLRNADTRSLS